MNLNKLHLVMIENGYSYFSGGGDNQMVYFDFSTGYNGRGNSISINVGISEDVCEVAIFKRGEASIEVNNLSFDEAIKFIENILNN